MGLLVCPLFVPLVSTSGPLQSHSAFVAVALWCVTSCEALMPQALCFLLKLLNIWISCPSIPAGAPPFQLCEEGCWPFGGITDNYW